MLAMKGVEKRFGALRLMVVDEWHDLLGTKRGTQVELASAWFRQVAPNYRCWGISATVGNLDEALRVSSDPAARDGWFDAIGPNAPKCGP